MRISRPCYDKAWRCPGWAGGGMRHARRDRCQGGSLAGLLLKYPAGFRRCPKCKVIILPDQICYIDPSYLIWAIKWKVRDWKWERDTRGR